MSLLTILLIILFLFFSPLILGLIFVGPQKKINLKHADSGLNKSGYIGYCWTYFFCGFFVPICRGEMLIGIFHFVFTVITFGLFHLVIPFLYNKQYTARMLTTGWKLNETEEKTKIAKQKLNITD